MLHNAMPTIDKTIFLLEKVQLEVGGKVLVQDCSFEVQKGNFLGLLGPNGAGKSSLLRLLYREKKLTSGRITALGQPLEKWGRKQFAAHVGSVLQEKAVLSGLTIEQVVALGLFPLHCPLADELKRVKHALELVELWDRRTENAGCLSGGEQQRLFFAQVIALDPMVYLLDEPNNHLDLYFQIRLLDYIKSKGKTVIASFHDMGLAARYCDNAVLMDNAKIVALGTMPQVLTGKNLKQVFRVDAELCENHLNIRAPID